MKSLLLALSLSSLLVASAAEPEKQLLWPEGAPLAQGDSDSDQPYFLIHRPKPEVSQGTAFVVCPGGGYGGLAVDHEGDQIAQWMVARGVTAFVLHYRLGSKGYHYPVQLIDVQRAIRWVRHHAADYGIDPDRLGIIGFSAGGHLTSMAATLFDERPEGMTNDAIDQESARPTVACPTYPVIHMTGPFHHAGSRKNLLGPRAEEEELANFLSTQNRVTEKTPPIFLFQTTEDTVVPAENAVSFYLACRAHGVPAEMHVFEPGRHGVGFALNDPVLHPWSDLLETWLRGKGLLSP
ncbi:MAG: alpha/beta hydrolase [Verrucomicrobiales bacterium]|nr:alpha/beta hydrolase [Verrucomicrobiales bacterium]